MTRLLQTLLAVLLAGSAGSIIMANSSQQPQVSFAWWRDSGLIKQLGLRSEQTTKIEMIWQETREELRAELDELTRRETKLSSMIDQGAEQAMVIRQIDRVESARANVSKTRAVMAYRMRAVLTTAQRKQFEAMAPTLTPTNRPAPGAPGPRPPAPGNSGRGSTSNISSTGSSSGPSSTGSGATGSSPGRTTSPR